MSRALEQPRTFADRAAEMIRGMIVAGEVKSGERLNEVSIAQMLGISRSPVREALNLLASERLVVFQPGRGAFVPEITPETVIELGEARRSLECSAVALAATRATPEELAAMTTVLAETEIVLERNDAGYPAGSDLHALILRASGNAVIEELAISVNTRMRLARLASGRNHTRACDAYAEHVTIVNALHARDAAAAEKAMRLHLDNAIRSAGGAMARGIEGADSA